MNIAIIEPVGGHGGMDYYDFGLASGLAEVGCNVIVYSCDETRIPSDLKFGCKLSFRGIYGNKRKFIRGLNFIRGLVASCVDAKRNLIDVVHMHFFHAGALELFSVLIVKALGFKLVITVHDVESFSGEGSTTNARRIFALADKLIAHNQVSVAELVEKVGVPAHHIEKIPHGNYTQQAGAAPSRDAARICLGIAADRQVVLFFGQIKKVKGLDLLLRAFAKIRRDHPRALLVIAGKVWKDDFSAYQEIISSSGIAGSVQLNIRYIPDEEALLYYAAADIVVLPYRRIYQSGVLLMAMSFGRLTLTSDLKGMTEIVEDGVNGLVFKTGDVEDLAYRLDLALEASNRDEMAHLGLKRMLEQHDWSAIGQKTADLYRLVRR